SRQPSQKPSCRMPSSRIHRWSQRSSPKYNRTRKRGAGVGIVWVSSVVVFLGLGRRRLSLAPANLRRRCGRVPGRIEVGIAKDDVALKAFHAVAIALAGNCGADLRFHILQRRRTLRKLLLASGPSPSHGAEAAWRGALSPSSYWEWFAGIRLPCRPRF